MRFSSPRLGLAALALGLALPPAVPVRALAAPPDSARAVRATPEALSASEFRLRRAVLEQSLGNIPGVIENLEAIDWAAESTFAEVDRAAFLLGQAYLRQGSIGRFIAFARRLPAAARRGPYARWMTVQLALIETEAAPPATDSTRGTTAVDAGQIGVAATEVLAADLLLRQGEREAALRLIERPDVSAASPALASYLRARALVLAGRDPDPALVDLSRADTITALGRDLAGAALIRRATRAIADGKDPRSLLGAVPAGSRYASRARHMLGLSLIESGDVELGARILASLMESDSAYAARREVAMALAGLALDAGRWQAATDIYSGIDQDWTRHRESLDRLAAEGSYDRLWASWQAGAPGSDALILDAVPARTRADQLAVESAALGSRHDLEVPSLRAPPPAPPLTRPVAPPPPEAWSALAQSLRAVDEATYVLDRTRERAARERARLDDRRRYFTFGDAQVEREAEALAGQGVLLDSLERLLDHLHDRVAAVRDESIHEIGERTARILADARDNADWVEAMRHFHVEGPNVERAVPPPIGFTSAEILTAKDKDLARRIRSFAERMGAEAPALIRRSYEDAWGPNLVDRVARLGVHAREDRSWALKLDASIDSSVAATTTSGTLRRLEAQAAGLGRRRDSLATAHDALRAAIARDAVKRALLVLAAEREGIDYGLAASAYGLSVRLAPTDSELASSPATHAAPSGAASASDQASAEEDDAETASQRARALPLLRRFLERHPDSPARAEMRFRLADLELVEARHVFRQQMAQFIRDQESGATGRPVPVLSHAGALGLYRSILAEDRDFPHRDAVLFNTGMILADEGSTEAAQFFLDLVTRHPQSAYGQEAYLRMGDLQFNERRFTESVAYYQHAATGPDPTLRTIAFYKMGWADFNQDRFAESADAFRSVLDLYASDQRPRIQVDIESEAETYLVHSFAGAGDTDALDEYFSRIGSPSYEKRIRMALGQHFRRYGKYEQAATSDQLFIRRYPADPDALVSAQRCVETHRMSNQPAIERQTRLDFAPQFAPDSRWAKAQPSDSVRAAGAAFARSCWTTVALEHHRLARAKGGREDWKQALGLYETLLSYWPDDAGAPTVELNAAEASGQLGNHRDALRHYEAVARTGPDSLAARAMWQRVAVTDSWYESTRAAAAKDGGRTGRDSLATAVIAAGDQLLARFPRHPEGADIVWRQSQLAFAHGWYEQAARTVDTMIERYPGDARAPVAACQRGEALFRLEQYDAAGKAFESALSVARQFGRDSLARRAARAIPVCAFRHAESAVAADSSRFERHAQLFDQVATRWPGYEHAHLAQYRAGLAYLKAGKRSEGVLAMETLIRTFPASEFVKDAHLQIARTWEAAGQNEKAAAAHLEFVRRYPTDETAAAAWLKAADLFAAAGLAPRAEELRLAYIRKHPEDLESAMEILEPLARRDLKGVTAQRPISTWVAARPPAPPAPKKGAPPMKAASVKRAPPASHLDDYLRRAESSPQLAARDVLAQVRFLMAEETQAAFAATRLTQPLKTSIPFKQKKLDRMIALYRQSVDLGSTEWANASTFRIGQSLALFGEALEKSERPADLSGDDLQAYEDVLFKESQTFYDRAEAVWSDLLRQNPAEEPTDPWVAQARGALWQRLASRFLFRPEVEYPVVDGSPTPSKPVAASESGARVRELAKQEGQP